MVPAGILETVPPAAILFSAGMLGWMLLMLFQNEIAIRQIDASIKEWAQQFDSDENPHCSSEQVPVGAGGAHTPPLHPIGRVNSASSRKSVGSGVFFTVFLTPPPIFSRVNNSSSGCASPQMRPLPKTPLSRTSSTAVPPLLPRSASLSPPRPDDSRLERLLYITRGRSSASMEDAKLMSLYAGGALARAQSFSPPKSARATKPPNSKTRRPASPVTRTPVRPFRRIKSSTSGIEPLFCIVFNPFVFAFVFLTGVGRHVHSDCAHTPGLEGAMYYTCIHTHTHTPLYILIYTYI